MVQYCVDVMCFVFLLQCQNLMKTNDLLLKMEACVSWWNEGSLLFSFLFLFLKHPSCVVLRAHRILKRYAKQNIDTHRDQSSVSGKEGRLRCDGPESCTPEHCTALFYAFNINISCLKHKGDITRTEVSNHIPLKRTCIHVSDNPFSLFVLICIFILLHWVCSFSLESCVFIAVCTCVSPCVWSDVIIFHDMPM